MPTQAQPRSNTTTPTIATATYTIPGGAVRRSVGTLGGSRTFF
jgi:hypothetical protein